MKQSIRAKLLAAFLTVIAVLTISEAFFFVMHFIVIQRYQKITDNLLSEYSLIGETSGLVNSFYDLIQYANNQQRMDAYNSNLVALQALLTKLDKNITDSGSWTVYLGVKSTVNGVIDETKTGVAAVLAGNISGVTNYYLDASKKSDFVRENTANLLVKEFEYVQGLQSDILKIQALSEIIGAVLFLVVIIFCLWYAFSFSQKFSRRLLQITKPVKTSGSDNLKANKGENSGKEGDEISDLTSSFSVMDSSLRGNIKKLKESEAQLAETQKTLSIKELKINELSETNRLKDEFIDVVMQKIKSSLIPILDLSEALEKNKDVLPPEYQKNIATIRERGVMLSQLIWQTLQAVNSENSEKEIEKERFNLDDLIMSMEASLKMLADRKGAKIVFRLQDRGVGMNSNKERISQVIYNFVNNAVEHGPNGQTIAVTMLRDGQNAVRVEVSDEGPGIPKEMQDKLFSNFYRPSKLASSRREGMGLELYICKCNVEMLGGEIGVISDVGKGAILYFTIPLVAGDGKKQEV